MRFSQKFISATLEKSTIEKSISAPLMRRDFFVDGIPLHGEITVCALGFYEIFVNGKHITRGRLSPYVVNPESCPYSELHPERCVSRLAKAMLTVAKRYPDPEYTKRAKELCDINDEWLLEPIL